MDTILLQQSDPVVLEVTTLTLEEHFKIVAFELLPTNLADVITSYSPKLAIIDYVLMGQQAITYLKQIRKLAPTLPVIVLSCTNNIASLSKNNGFDGYLTKPFDIESLVKMVKRYINLFHSKTIVFEHTAIYNPSY